MIYLLILILVVTCILLIIKLDSVNSKYRDYQNKVDLEIAKALMEHTRIELAWKEHKITAGIAMIRSLPILPGLQKELSDD